MNTQEKAFEFASGTSKLLISLSTGIITILVAFLNKDALLSPDGLFDKVTIIISWILLLASAIAGIWTQLAITNVLEPKPKVLHQDFDQTIQNEKIKTPFKFQILLFGIGMLATVIYGIIQITFLSYE